MVNNLSEIYYKEEFEMDMSVLKLDHDELLTQINYYDQEYIRCAELEINFLLSRNLKENLEELRQQL